MDVRIDDSQLASNLDLALFLWPYFCFITEASTVRAILTHIGEPSEAPPISPCR